MLLQHTCCRLHISEQPPRDGEQRPGGHARSSTREIDTTGVAEPTARARSLPSRNRDCALPVKKLPLVPVWEFMKWVEGWSFYNKTYGVWFPGVEETKMDQHEVRACVRVRIRSYARGCGCDIGRRSEANLQWCTRQFFFCLSQVSLRTDLFHSSGRVCSFKGSLALLSRGTHALRSLIVFHIDWVVTISAPSRPASIIA